MKKVIIKKSRRVYQIESYSNSNEENKYFINEEINIDDSGGDDEEDKNISKKEINNLNKRKF